ncbi:MAG: protein kinase, partial [Verrucomicrobiaceae bacterium]
MATDTLSQLRAGQLTGAVRLDLSADLTDFPREILDLADSLEVLNLSNNRLASLPDDLPRLKKLRIVFLSQNDFTHVPPVLGECPGVSMIGLKSNRITEVDGRAFPKTLRWLILTDNQVSTLPDELGECPALQKLMLAGNRLKSLPDSMAACQNLELIRLAANEFEELPEWLWRLPRLAWLALAGNPCAPGAGPSAGAPLITEVPWAGLALEEKLGEGASGVIHRAQWSGSGAVEPQAVAVKIFKGAVTSDGLPSSEMAAWMAAGEHPNLISVRGRVTGHPEGADALVMPLVPSGFRSLAGPPSLESCTRDVYPDGFQTEPATVLKL